MEHIGAAQTRQASKNAVRRAQEEAAANVKTSRLQFTAEELSNPELEAYIRKSQKAADNLDAAREALPKEKVLVKERVFEEATGKGKTRLHFEEREKPMPNGKHHKNPLSRPAQEAGIFVHNKIHEVEKDNSGVEGAHKTEEVTERGAKYGARKIREGYHRHKLKPYRAAAKAEKAAFKANVEFQYQKLLQENPQLAASNPLSRYWQKQQIKKQYAKAVRTGGVKSAKSAADHTQKAAKKTTEFVTRHWKGVVLLIAALLLFIMTAAGVSSCSSLFSGLMNGVLGTSYTSEDSDLVAVENNYATMENELQQRIDNIERDYPGYDEYRYDLDNIGHNPHALASYLTALLQSYTPQSAQAELERIFNKDKKIKKADKSDWVIFEGTQEPIIDKETWSIVQNLRKHTRRTDSLGEANPLTGKVFCGECGSLMYNHRRKNGRVRVYYTSKGERRESYSKPEDCYACSKHILTRQTYKAACSGHHIRTSALRSIVLECIRKTCSYVQSNPEEFLELYNQISESQND